MKAAVYQGKEQLIVQEVPEPSEVEVTLEMESAVDDRITDVEETKNLLGSVEEQFPGHIHLWAPGVGTKHGFGDDMDFDPANVEYQRKLTKEITGREIGIALHGSTGMSADDLTKVRQRINVLNGDGKASDITNL